MTTDGELVILARRFRTQEANRADARARLSDLIDEALKRPERRIKTKPGKPAKARRVHGNKPRGAIKATRGRVHPTDRGRAPPSPRYTHRPDCQHGKGSCREKER